MKKVLLSIFTLVSLVSAANGQHLPASKVPAAVKTAFIKQYPGTPVKWEKEDAAYEAGFKKSGRKMSVNYSAKGEVVETENEIAVSALPATAQKYMTKNFPGQKVSGAAKIVKNDGSITFEAELRGMDVIFDSNGRFVKKEKDQKSEYHGM